MRKLDAKITGGQILISFSCQKSDFYKLLESIKVIPGRRFDSRRKTWEIPLNVANVKKLREIGFNVPERGSVPEPAGYPPIMSIPVPGLKKKLKPFQEVGVGFLEKTQGRAIIADEMGLGKTLQAIAYLELHPELRPAIVVCPASVKYVWQQEFAEATKDQKTIVLSGKSGGPLLGDNNIIIINYDIVEARLEQLRAMSPKVVILDESHYIKDPSAKRTKAIRELCSNAPHIICLSGTPITNRPIEFFSTLNLIDPYLFPNRFKFALRYCNAQKNRWGWDMSGASNLEELNRILAKSIMIRRRKQDVLAELPSKTRVSVPLEIDNKKEYQKIEENVVSWIWENEGLEAAAKATKAEYLVQIEKLKQASARGKLKSAIRWIADFLDTGEKLILFCTHSEILDKIKKEFQEVSVRLDGSTPQEHRPFLVEMFQKDEGCKLFIGNIKAAGVGLTLTAASNVAFLEFDWVPGVHLQAEDRAHRIGQKENVSVYYLIGKETIDERLVSTLRRKSEVLGQILDGVTPEENDTFKEILCELKS